MVAERLRETAVSNLHRQPPLSTAVDVGVEAGVEAQGGGARGGAGKEVSNTYGKYGLVVGGLRVACAVFGGCV